MSAHDLYRAEDVHFDVDAATIIERLGDVLSGESLIVHESGMRPYECDGLAAYKQLPLAVAIPENVEQVRGVLRVCSELNVPIVARGSGTSLSGGSLPHPQGIVLSMAKFNRIREVDPRRRIARVEPGVRNLAITEAAAPHGLYYAPDPSSQIACSIGGNVSENAGGVHCLKYGLTVHNVLSVTAVTIDGEIVRIGSEAPDSVGYDLLALFHGSEGMLAVITEITVQLLANPLTKQVLMASFDDVEAGGHTVAAIIAAGIVPGGLEMMDGLAIQAAEDFVHAGYDTEAAAILICELDGSETEVADQLEAVQGIMRDNGATRIQVAETDDDKARFWAGRKAAFPAVGRVSPDYYCMDGTIPRKQLAYVLRRISEMSAEYGLQTPNVVHAGDGNLHPLILFDGNAPGQLEKAEELGSRILQLCVEVGGTVTGEHGVGMEKINEMCVQFQPDELEQFHAIKSAFDPARILNPGKAVPTLNRCAEFGRLHVHQGQLPHPELERF
ncbi:MAG TPA: FAD-linked oxidase C-terminal domain-containing protein [Gammaproteobacteria bacterium]|nr:FAD-linked oxidase C-terminal domain-containing protein [Gammaproteobacteria bacterium]